MDKQEMDSVISNAEDTVQLNRNRSFKSKQLVRSQAIRETQSPPRTSSPAVVDNNEPTRDSEAIGDAKNNVDNEINNVDNAKNNIDNVINDSETRTLSEKASERDSSHSDSCSDGVSYIINNDFTDYNKTKQQQPVEIQITSGGWDVDQHSDQRLRTKRWLGHRDRSESSRDLLSNNPRVACVCGNCAACPHCRGRRRKQYCPTKQDSGIVCSDECPDCSDNEASGQNYEGVHKTSSLDAEELNYYCRCPEKKEKPKNTVLTRSDSDEKSEPTGPELVTFIKETLNKNARDRMTLLKIEKELHALINDTGRCIVRFPVMTSYGRMLVHRCASLFQLSHHLDQASKTCVMVSKSGTSGGRIPCTSFRQWCTVNFPPSPQRYQPDSINARSILKRDTHSLDEPSGGTIPSNRSKSLEQREKEYERVRRRIFSSDESQWPWMSGPVRVLTSEAGRNKLLKVQSLENSTSGCWRARGTVSKSHSFSGPAPPPPPPDTTSAAPSRLLSRQGDLASSSWRLSPSSSGYKTLSLRSTDSVTPSPTGGASPEPAAAGVGSEGVVWAVTDLNSVPPGAVVIHPQTGRPLMNPDGSLYHFDPAHPPVLYDIAYKHDEFKNENSEKKRGRLEKQHSFIDNDCECQPSEECRSKCCSECGRHETCQPKTTIDKETNTKPETPTINDNEDNQNHTSDVNNHKPVYEATVNHKPVYEATANHKPVYEATANHKPVYEATANHKPVYEATANHKPVYEATANHKPVYEATANHKPVYEATANHKPVYEATANHKPVYEATANHKPVYEATANHKSVYDATANHKPTCEEETNQNPPFETPTVDNERPYELTNQAQEHYQNCQRVDVQRNYEAVRESSNYQAANEVRTTFLTNQESRESQQYLNTYGQAYSSDEVTSPTQVTGHLVQADVAAAQHTVAKVAPIAMPDPNIRPVSLTNVMYPAGIPQGYAYGNQCRLDPALHPPIYQGIVPSDDAKQLAPSPHVPDTTFRIDPSYPYGAIEYTAAGCGACIDNSMLQQNPHRSYSVPYNQMEMQPVLQPTYPIGNVLMPQPHLQPYPYQDAVQWTNVQPAVAQPPKLLVSDIYPLVQYTAPYPQYNLMYPQVIQQPYPVCQPVYPMVEKQPEVVAPRGNFRGRSKYNSCGHTPHQTPPEVGMMRATPPRRQDNSDIAIKIQQIKEQMAQLNTKDKDKDRRRDDWKRRSSNGLLGNYPTNHNYHERNQGRVTNDESQLSNEARVIVNSIRNMQSKNTYQGEGRNPGQRSPRVRGGREEARHSAPEWHHGRARPMHPFSTGVYRPPYLFRQMSPNAWCRRSPGPVHPVFNNPRRPHPDSRNGGRR